ncbi:g10066 [Coccomyxa viridis]|uniref:G10066 protein n=1 Tax=Coccomyxa viridis TaxID=1274662 RepID=A0ABP1GAK5_9CHLO
MRASGQPLPRELQDTIAAGATLPYHRHAHSSTFAAGNGLRQYPQLEHYDAPSALPLPQEQEEEHAMHALRSLRSSSLSSSGANAPGADAPHDLRCPITLELLEDPVIAADGKTCSREDIADWFVKGRLSSPPTSKELDSFELKPDYEMRARISRWQQECQAAQQRRASLMVSSPMTNMQRGPPERPLACRRSNLAPLRMGTTLMDSNLSPLQSSLWSVVRTVSLKACVT